MLEPGLPRWKANGILSYGTACNLHLYKVRLKQSCSIFKKQIVILHGNTGLDQIKQPLLY
jgi:hypothetical protein